MTVQNVQDDEWVLRKKRGKKARFQNTRTGAWSDWEPVEIVGGVEPHTIGSEPEPESKYAQMSRDDLRKLAALRGIAGRGKMSKAELAEALFADDQQGGEKF